MIRPSCGTVRGALAHQAAGEAWCGWCAQAERSARLAAEAGPSLPGSPHGAVTAAEAQRHAQRLDIEVAAHEGKWKSDRNWRGQHLRVVPPADGESAGAA